MSQVNHQTHRQRPLPPKDTPGYQSPLPSGSRLKRETPSRLHKTSTPNSHARRAYNTKQAPAGYPPIVTDHYTSGPQSNTFERAFKADISRAYANMAQLELELTGELSTKTALQAPDWFRATLKSDSTIPIILDSSASVTITPSKEDFEGPLEKPGTITQLKGIAEGLQIEGQGHVLWSFHDVHGGLRTLSLPAYYVPKVRVRLLSTTSHLQQYEDEIIKIEVHQLTLSGVDDDPTRPTLVACVNPDNNLPTSDAYRKTTRYKPPSV
jgi:hypothetical protein